MAGGIATEQVNYIGPPGMIKGGEAEMTWEEKRGGDEWSEIS